MINKIIILYLITTSLKSLSTSTIECQFEDYTYIILGTIYRCLIINNPNIISEETAHITNLDGQHQPFKSNEDVIGLAAIDKTIQYLPQNINDFFPNLKAIWIENCELKKIQQSELKNLPNLVNLYLPKNNIGNLEQDLFEFNHNLELIGLGRNNILFIDPNIFDNLQKLRYLWLEENLCINEKVDDSSKGVEKIIKLVKIRCTNANSELKNFKIVMTEGLKNVSEKIDDINEFKKNIISFINDTNLTQNCPSTQLVTDSISNITLKMTDFKSCQDDSRILQYDMKASISNIESTLAGLKTFQNDVKIDFSKIKTTQNELKMTIEELKLRKDNEFEDKLTAISEKLESIESHFAECEAKGQLEVNKNLLKMSAHFDEKIKGIENRILKKFEEIFEEKLRKVLDEKLGQISVD